MTLVVLSCGFASKHLLMSDRSTISVAINGTGYLKGKVSEIYKH